MGRALEVIRHTFNSHKKNPSLRISIIAGLHGDELDGIFICNRLIDALKKYQEESPEVFQGEINIYPAVNPQALNSASRLWPFYSIDMNRTFGNSANNSLPVTVSQEIFQDIQNRSDWALDIHSSNLFLKELPQIRIIEEFSKHLLSAAEKTNADLIWVHPMAGLFESTLGYNLNQQKVKTLVIESGICLRIHQNYCEQLFLGIMNLLQHLEILNFSPASHFDLKKPKIIQPTQVSINCSNKSGLFISKVRLGQYLIKGDPIGEIIDPQDGEILEEVFAEQDGLLFTLREHPLIYSGALLARIALENEPEP